MHRRKFLAGAIALSTLATRAVARQPKAVLPRKAFSVKSGESRFGVRTPFRGINPNDLKVSAKDTNGMLSVFEYVGKEKVGPSLHVHFEQDEIFYVVEGEYRFQVGDEQLIAKAGDTVFGPRNVPHTWIQLSDAGKMVYSVQPAGTLEAFFSQMSQLKGPPTADEIQKIHQAHDMKVVGPPLTLH